MIYQPDKDLANELRAYLVTLRLEDPREIPQQSAWFLQWKGRVERDLAEGREPALVG